MKLKSKVKVKENQKQTSDFETFYYIEKFKGKQGTIYEITKTEKGVACFHVDFGNESGVFYENEIEVVTS